MTTGGRPDHRPAPANPARSPAGPAHPAGSPAGLSNPQPPVTVKGSSTFVAELVPVRVTEDAPGRAGPGTLTVAPEMTPSPLAFRVVVVRPEPKVPRTVS